MHIANIRNPRYSAADNSLVDVTCELNGETIDFTASPNDTTDHGLDIYERAVAGEFGSIAAYVAPPAPPAPPEPTKAELMAQLAALTAKIQALPSE